MQPKQLINQQLTLVVSKPLLNPFHHIGLSLKRTFSINPQPAIGLTILSVALGVGASLLLGLFISLVLLPFFLEFISALSDHPSSSSRPSTTYLALLLPALFITCLLASTYVTQALNRVLLESVRGHKVSFVGALSFVKSRFLLTLGTNIFLGLLFITMFSIVVSVTKLNNIIGIVADLTAFVIFIIAALRLCYVNITIVDDDKPTGIRAVFAKSKLLSRRSGKAVVLLVVMYFAVLFLFSYISKTTTPTSPVAEQFIAVLGASSMLGSSFIYLLFNSMLQLVPVAALVNIYREAEDGTNQIVTATA